MKNPNSVNQQTSSSLEHLSINALANIFKFVSPTHYGHTVNDPISNKKLWVLNFLLSLRLVSKKMKETVDCSELLPIVIRAYYGHLFLDVTFNGFGSDEPNKLFINFISVLKIPIPLAIMDMDNRQQHIALPSFLELSKLKGIYRQGREVEITKIKRSLADSLYRNQAKFLSAINAPSSKERFAEYTDTILRLSFFSAKRQVLKLAAIMSLLGLETALMPFTWGLIHDCFAGPSPKTFKCTSYPVYEDGVMKAKDMEYLLVASFCTVLLNIIENNNRYDVFDSRIFAINDDRFLNRCKIFFMLTIAMIIPPLLVHPVCTYQPYTSKSLCSDIATAINLLEGFNTHYFIPLLLGAISALMGVTLIGDLAYSRLLYFAGYLTELYFASSSKNKNSNQPVIHYDKAMYRITDTVAEMESCAPRPHIWWTLPPAKKNEENNLSKTIMY